MENSYSKYYLYLHRTLNGIPIYIGIGTKFYGDNENLKLKYSRAYASTRNIFWKRVIKKYGFIVEILLESNDYEFIKQQEIHFIKLFGRVDKKEGTLCNLTDGGEGVLGKVYTDTDLKNISNGQKKRFANPSEQDIIHLQELYSRTSERMKGNTYRKGCSLTKDQKDNLCTHRIAKLSKRVIQKDLEGNFIKEWYTTVEAAAFYNVTYKAIWKACKQGDKVKKFIWEFKN